MSSPARRAVRFEIAPRTLAWLAGAVAGLWLLYQLRMVLLLLLVALVFVGTFNPVLEAIEARGHRRGRAMVLLVAALGLIAVLLAFLTVPALMDQLAAIARDLPAHREKLIELLAGRRMTLPLSHALADVGVDQGLARLQSYLAGYWTEAVEAVGFGLTTLFLSLYLLADGKRTRGALYAVVPRRYHMRLARIIHNLEAIVGGYMRAQLITSAASAAFTFVLLAACGVRGALALALFSGLMDVLPFVGGILAIVPATFAALSGGPTTGMVVFSGLTLYQLFDNKILVPKVYGQALRLSPAAVVLAMIAGGVLLGITGALLALPIAAGLQMILEELGVDMPGDDSDLSRARERDDKTDAAYALMSAGATAPDAGQIAGGLAQDLREADAWVAAREAKKKSP